MFFCYVKKNQLTRLRKLHTGRLIYPVRCLLPQMSIKITLASPEQIKQNMRDDIFHSGSIPENINVQVENVRFVSEGKKLSKNELGILN